MATASLVPSRDSISVEPVGVEPGLVGITAALPALGSALGMATGNPLIGQLASTLLGIPGQTLEYAAQRDAANRANQDRERAIETVGNFYNAGMDLKSGLYVNRPSEYDQVQNPMVKAITQALANRKQLARSMRGEVQGLDKEISAQGVELSPGVQSGMERAIEQKYRAEGTSTTNQLLTSALSEWNDLKMSIGTAETNRRQANAQMRLGVMSSAMNGALSTLLSSLDSVTATGVFNSVTEGLQFLEQTRLAQEQIDAQERASERAANASLWGASIGAASNVAAGGLTAWGAANAGPSTVINTGGGIPASSYTPRILYG